MISVVFLLVVAVFVATPAKVYAACESDGAYGQNCVYNKSFKITKKVRIKDEGDFEDKVTGVKEGQVVEFKVKVKNVGEVAVDDLKMTDILPEELYRVGGSGLTEYLNDLKVGETETFVIEAKIKEIEFDRTDNFENCVVNKAKLERNGDFEGSDTATVCYGDSDIKELPETGADSTGILTIFGLISTGLGMILKRK